MKTPIRAGLDQLLTWPITNVGTRHRGRSPARLQARLCSPSRPQLVTCGHDGSRADIAELVILSGTLIRKRPQPARHTTADPADDRQARLFR